MKKLIIISILLLFNMSCGLLKKTQTTELEFIITDILNLAHEKNINEINSKYIKKDFGIYDIHRIGVPDRFKLLNEIPGFTQEWSIYHAIVNVKTRNAKIKSENVQYSCDNSIWSNSGVFYDRNLKYPLLSEIITYETLTEDEEFSVEEINKVKFIEKNSIRVVDTNSDLVFYLTNIDQKWYLTVIDRVTTDCSY